MSILYFTGFEQGNTRTTNGSDDYQPPTAGGSVSSDVAKTGTYSYKIVKSTTETPNIRIPTTYADNGVVSVAAGNFSTLCIEFDFYYTTKPSSNYEEICNLLHTGTQATAIFIAIDSSGQLALYNNLGGSPVLLGSSSALSSSTWYKIGLKVIAGASGSYLLEIDDTSAISGSWTDTTNFLNYLLGARVNRNSQAVTAYFDNVVVNDTDLNDGELRVVVLKPNANGSTMTWTGGTGGSDYQEVDEIPISDTDYVSSPNSGNPNTALFNLESSATGGVSGTILSFKAVIMTRENTSSTSATIITVKSGATSSSSTTFNGTTSTQGRVRILNTDPNTSSAWTSSGIDAVEIGGIENNAVITRMISALGYVLFQPATSAIKSVNGLAIASVKSKNGLAKASIKNINGLA